MLRHGILTGYLGRNANRLSTFLPEGGPERDAIATGLARALGGLARTRPPLLIAQIDGRPPRETALGARLRAMGFAATAHGYLLRGARASTT